MKYIEELGYGSTFQKNGDVYLLTSDFKKDHKKAHSLKDGSSRWFRDDEVVEVEPLYLLDKDNNLVAIKECKDNATNTAKNLNIS